MEGLQPIKAQLTTEGFNDLFEQFMKEDIPYTQAYVKAEEYHIKAVSYTHLTLPTNRDV